VITHLFDLFRTRKRKPRQMSLVFDADFSSHDQWAAGRTWAFPGGGPINPADHKLDHLTPDPHYSRSGTFRATRRTDGRWDTGLLTTEGSRGNFMLRTGDVIAARVRLPDTPGAWPAIWTWRDGGQEIDIFEYHPDNPDQLELTNHVRRSQHYHRDPRAIQPGAVVDMQVGFGTSNITWRINGQPVFADGRGVGPHWKAHIIVNLSVSAGRYHPAPADDINEMSFEVVYLRVYRPRDD
jgi:hypothetical protein